MVRLNKLKTKKAAGGGSHSLLLKKQKKKNLMKKKKMKVVEEEVEEIEETDEQMENGEDLEEVPAANKKKAKSIDLDVNEEEEDKDEDDSDAEGAGDHLGELAKLKDKDPEFYKFLQEQDSDLLNFEVSDEEEEDHEEEAEKEQAAPEESGPRRPKIRKDRDGRQIFDAGQLEYLEERLEEEKVSVGAAKLGVEVFAACVARVGADVETPSWIINEQEIFDAVVRLCFRRLGVVLFELLGKVDGKEETIQKHGDSEGDIIVSTGKVRFRRWKRHQGLAKVYLNDLLTFLREVQTPAVIITTLKCMAGVALLYAQYPKLSRLFVKSVVRIWTRKTLDARMMAYVAMNAFIKHRPSDFAFLYKSCYMGFVSCARAVQPDTWPLLQFMYRAMAQLTMVNPAVAYQYAFVYIRQIAIHIRNAVIGKRKDLVQSVYNWQMIQCLYIWTHIISHAHTSQDTDALCELSYPLIQVIVAILRLFPSQRYLPLRIHCVQLLLQLQVNCDKFIQVLSLSVDLFGELVLLSKSKPRETKLNSKALNLQSTLKALAQQIESPQWRRTTADEIFKLTVQSAHALSTNPAFADLTFPVLAKLRSLQKQSKNPELTQLLRTLHSALQEHATWVRRTIAPREADVNDNMNVLSLKFVLKAGDNPMAKFHAQWSKYWKMREEAMNATDQGSRRDRRESKQGRDGRRREEKGGKRMKREEDEEEEEYDGEMDEAMEEMYETKKKKAASKKSAPEEGVGKTKKLKKKKEKLRAVKADASIPDAVEDLAEWSD